MLFMELESARTLLRCFNIFNRRRKYSSNRVYVYHFALRGFRTMAESPHSSEGVHNVFCVTSDGFI